MILISKYGMVPEKFETFIPVAFTSLTLGIKQLFGILKKNKEKKSDTSEKLTENAKQIAELLSNLDTDKGIISIDDILTFEHRLKDTLLLWESKILDDGEFNKELEDLRKDIKRKIKPLVQPRNKKENLLS